jgi:SAM-dependent methyltransferase
MVQATLSEAAYWTANWDRGRGLPRSVDPDDRSLANSVDRAWHGYFRRALAGMPPGSRLLEIGAARSRWLPYFAERFGFAVTGLDYSAQGCVQAREMLARAGLPGEVVCADLFEPPPELLGRFDIVVSFGVVEHFHDTASCVAACARLLARDGRMITTIPNMRGTLGGLQRVLDPRVYRMHVPLRARDLAAAHGRAGLEVVRCGYEMPANWRVAVVKPGRLGRRSLRKGLAAASRLAWAAERIGVRVPPNRLTSPYIACLARRPAGKR